MLLLPDAASVASNDAEAAQRRDRVEDKVQFCLANCVPLLKAKNLSFVSELVSCCIQCLRLFYEKELDQTGCLPYLSIFTILHVLFSHLTGPMSFETAVVNGLVSESGQALNGRLVEVMSFDAVSGRFCCRVTNGDPKRDWKRVKPENLDMQVTTDSGNKNNEDEGDDLLAIGHDWQDRKKTGGTTGCAGSKASAASSGRGGERGLTNCVGISCLESIADIFDELLKEIVVQIGRSSYQANADVLGRLTLRAMWKMFVACIGGVSKLAGRRDVR